MARDVQIPYYESSEALEDEVMWQVYADVELESSGNFRGHPDNWYPAEGGSVEITHAVCKQLQLTLDYDEMVKRFGSEDVSWIESELYDRAIDDMESDKEAAMISAYESRMEADCGW
jgi:hypothetical protein